MDSQPLKANVKPSHKDTVAKAAQIAGELAEERLKIDRAQKRATRRRGEKPPQARRSAIALVRETMEAYRPQIEPELKALRR